MLYSLETGQLALAAWAAASNASGVALGILALSSRWLDVIENPSPTLSRLMTQFVFRLSAVKPAFCRTSDKAMVKQPA